MPIFLEMWETQESENLSQVIGGGWYVYGSADLVFILLFFPTAPKILLLLRFSEGMIGHREKEQRQKEVEGLPLYSKIYSDGVDLSQLNKYTYNQALEKSYIISERSELDVSQLQMSFRDEENQEWR